MNTNIKTGLSFGSHIIVFLLLLVQSQLIYAEQPAQKDVPDFLVIVKRYADAMIAQGRDTYGAEHSPLFASALIRETMQPDQNKEIDKIDGVRENDRSLTGANLIHDIDLYRILYELSVVCEKNIYADEADKAIQFFFKNCQSPATGLMCWGEHLFWDFYTDQCGHGPGYDFHEAKKWPFWDQTYKLAPDAAWKFVISEWDHQINDKSTGDFSRHARYSKHETFSGFDFPRYAGQMIERWADAYNRPENASRPRKNELLTAIKVLVNRMEENMQLSESGYLIAGRSPKGDHNSVVWLTNNLELARCLEEAAPTMNSKLANEMKELALKQDIDFLKAPHKLDSVGGGFAVTLHAQTGLPRTRNMNKPYTSTWSSGYGYGTHGEVANICYNRYKSLKNEHLDMAEQYKNLTLKVADMYLKSAPDTTILLKPNEFSEVIELMLNAYELSRKKKYLDRAVFFARSGIDLFLNDESPLPKATNRHNHYESITGGPAFMYQLLRLHEMF